MAIVPPANSTLLPTGLLTSILESEVLYEAEGTVLFTAETELGRVVAYVADDTVDGRWLLLAPCNDPMLVSLRLGHIAVRDALFNSWTWLAQLNGVEVTSAWRVEEASLPAEHLPTPGVFLTADLDPVLTTRAEGSKIVREATPASVLAYVSDATCKALKGILDFVMENDVQGRPTDDLRSRYDLPIHSLAFGSFQVAFGAPPKRLFPDDSLDRSVKLLQKGLRWAADEGSAPSPGATEAERGAVLRAILRLTPPSTGVIERIDVGGRWMNKGAVVLKRPARKRVQAELRKVSSERIVVQTGIIDELDKNGTFILRHTANGKDVKGSFDEGLYDDLLDHFANDDIVGVIGVERNGRLYATAVNPGLAEKPN